MEAGKKKMLATLVGCNYAGTKYKLRGCINDVHEMHAVLLDRFGFARADITVLTDERGAAVLPTGANIKHTLRAMVARAEPGDVLLFYFSGHGTQIPPIGDQGGRHDEAIVPCDFNFITDDDLGEIVGRVPVGATFTMVSDSCYSGGLIDEEKEQIGPAASAATDDVHAHATHAGPGRFIPYTEVLAHLSAASGLDATDHVASHLVALFGDDASTKFRVHHHKRAADAHAHAHAHAGILLSGSQKDETSADVPRRGDRAAHGAFTGALQDVLAAHPALMSNRELVRGTREVLRKQGFKQHPCLYCSDANADAPFLGQQGTKAQGN